MNSEKFGQIEEVMLELRDKNGNIKLIWNENVVYKFFRMKFNFELPRISFLLGRWKDKLIIK